MQMKNCNWGIRGDFMKIHKLAWTRMHSGGNGVGYRRCRQTDAEYLWQPQTISVIEGGANVQSR